MRHFAFAVNTYTHVQYLRHRSFDEWQPRMAKFNGHLKLNLDSKTPQRTESTQNSLRTYHYQSIHTSINRSYLIDNPNCNSFIRFLLKRCQLRKYKNNALKWIQYRTIFTYIWSINSFFFNFRKISTTYIKPLQLKQRSYLDTNSCFQISFLGIYFHTSLLLWRAIFQYYFAIFCSIIYFYLYIISTTTSTTTTTRKNFRNDKFS